MKKLTFVLVSFLFFTLAGCNTVKGVGQDLAAGGKAISHSAEKHGASEK